jgi:hypothetical protein
MSDLDTTALSLLGLGHLVSALGRRTACFPKRRALIENAVVSGHIFSSKSSSGKNGAG